MATNKTASVWTAGSDSALAARLSRETSGDVLFDAFDRGRYANDASFYQIVPAGVEVESRYPASWIVVGTSTC